MARHRGLTLSVALLTCIATITSVRWLSSLITGDSDLALPSAALQAQQQGKTLVLHLLGLLIAI